MEDATMEQDQPDTAKRKMEQMASRDTKPKRQRKTKSTAVKDENSDSSETPHDIDPTSWPPEFKQLEQVFQSLNTVYTFCCTRKHFATTFESIKASVESLTRR
jgi:DEAD/DEAH box helicase domain-containing protein